MCYMNKIYKLLYSNQIGKMPDEIKHRKNIILTLTIISTLFLDILSFSIKGAQAALAADMKSLALTLMVLYFIRQVVRSSIQIFIDNHKNILYSQEDVYISEKVSHISNVVRGKVFQKSNNSSLIMTNSEVIFNLKEYISYVWNFFQSYPIAISEILTALGLSIAILITEFVQTGNIQLTISFSVVLIVCIILFSLFEIIVSLFSVGEKAIRKIRAFAVLNRLVFLICLIVSYIYGADETIGFYGVVLTYLLTALLHNSVDKTINPKE